MSWLLTMISVTDGSSSSRCSGPCPSTSSATSRSRRCRSSKVSGVVSCSTISASSSRTRRCSCSSLNEESLKRVPIRVYRAALARSFSSARASAGGRDVFAFPCFPGGIGAAASTGAAPRTASSRWDSLISHPPPRLPDAARVHPWRYREPDRYGRRVATTLSQCDPDPGSEAVELPGSSRGQRLSTA